MWGKGDISSSLTKHLVNFTGNVLEDTKCYSVTDVPHANKTI